MVIIYDFGGDGKRGRVEMNRAKNKITSTNVNTSSVFITHHPSMYFRKANIRHPLTFFDYISILP